MKKRNILLSFILVLTMLLAGCGSSNEDGNPFEGKWKGTLDVTTQFEDGICAYYPELEEYVEFEDLVFVIDIEFADGVMSMSVDEASIETFNANFEAGMEKIALGSLEAQMSEYDMTIEEVVAESGMTEEKYLENVYKQMKINEMSDAMNEVTNSTLAGLSKMTGTYTFNDDRIKLRYSDDSFESFKYEFDGDELDLIVKGDGYSLLIECEKNE